MIATLELTPHPPPSPARVWFGILGAPAAWAVQGLLGWLVASVGCAPGDAGWFAPATAHALELGVSAVALAVAAAALAAGCGAMRGAPRLHESARPDFLAAAATLVSSVFVIAVLLTAIPYFMLPMCEAAR